ncbi:cytochrome b [Sphingorhabdus arenilitoris]|uniref:Cytochrome b n=1 Tax=Sphingorhabdus arenilitoris TaxID=1490041 RepID=A0ABV8RKW3_9SPHN
MNHMNISKYSKGAIAFHWIIAALVIANIGLAELTEDMTRAARGPYMDLHKSFGICILFLTFLRLGWRWTHPRPALPASLAGWERLLSKAVHFVFYVLLIGMPLGGWLWMSTHGDKAAIDMFGLFTMPVLPVTGNEALGDLLHEGHEIGGKAMLILVILHILAALKHQLIDRMPFIQRMWP